MVLWKTWEYLQYKNLSFSIEPSLWEGRVSQFCLASLCAQKVCLKLSESRPVLHRPERKESLPDPTRWAPTSYKWSYNPCKWPYKWVTGVITLPIGVITPFITGRVPPCRQQSLVLVQILVLNLNDSVIFVEKEQRQSPQPPNTDTM